MDGHQIYHQIYLSIYTSYQNHEMICLAKNYFLLFFNPHILHFKFLYFPMLFNRALLLLQYSQNYMAKTIEPS